jgi:UrcA family protein
MKSHLLVALSLTAAIIPSNAVAQRTESTIHVGYGDLDLGTAIGRTKLHARLKRAIRHVCDVPGPALIESRREFDACVDQAWAYLSPQLQVAMAAAGTRLAEINQR